MAIDWARIERRQPTAADIAKAVKKAKKLPDAGDGGHVMAPWPKADEVPETTKEDWADSKLKRVKIAKLKATTMRLDRVNLIWHLERPGQSKYRGQWNTHPQVVDTDEGRVIVDGHHRLAALMMLGINKDSVWLLKHKDIG
jgi:hypothetical protein